VADRRRRCADAGHGGADGRAAETIHLSKSDQLRQSNQPSVILPQGRNPATGEAIKIKASKKVAFRVAKELKEAV
jgi:DNA-binding protein HU-beta